MICGVSSLPLVAALLHIISPKPVCCTPVRIETPSAFRHKSLYNSLYRP